MTKKRTLAAPRAVDPVRKVTKRLSAPRLVAGKGTPRQIADAALKRLASKLKIDPKLADLKYEKVRETILGKHVTYQQYHAGKPVSGAWIRVDIDKDGHVYQRDQRRDPDADDERREKALGGGLREGGRPGAAERARSR